MLLMDCPGDHIKSDIDFVIKVIINLYMDKRTLQKN